MTHTVAVGQFEGPLGLLLELIERGQIEVSRVSVSAITSRYLARLAEMESQTPEELSEFLELGARLLYIKSLSLLPNSAPSEQGGELEKLNLELAEYRQMQTAAHALAARLPARTWPRSTIERLAPNELPYPDVALPELRDAFARALSRVEPARPSAIIKHHLSQEAVSAKLRRRLGTGGFDLQELIDACHDRLEIIVTFLSLLELLRQGAARVAQVSQFARITVEPTHV